MTAGDIDVTAVIVNYNTRELLRPCLDALRASAAGLRLQIVIVDNGSRDGSADALRAAEFADCDLLVNSTNVGFGRANNQTLALARGRHKKSACDTFLCLIRTPEVLGSMKATTIVTRGELGRQDRRSAIAGAAHKNFKWPARNHENQSLDTGCFPTRTI